MSHLQLAGPTVTVFGDRDVLGEALSDELSRRGLSTHEVTTPMGWFRSSTHAVIRLDAPPGRRAIEQLAADDAPSAHLVAVGRRPDDASEARRLEELCRQCSARHDVSVIWHPSFELGTDDGCEVASDDLAVAIADELIRQAARTSTPSLVSRTIEGLRDVGQP